MNASDELAVFSIQDKILQFRHDVQIPTVIAERPGEVTSFAFRGEDLVDGCRDGKVRKTFSGEVVLDYGQEVLGVGEAHSSSLGEGKFDTDRLLGKVVDRFQIDRRSVSNHPLVVVTRYEEHGVQLWLDDHLFATIDRRRSGKAQFLVTYRDFFWADNGSIFCGFDRSRTVKQFRNDFVQLVPYSYLGDFLFIWNANNDLETKEFLQNREGRVLWSHDRKDDGCVEVAGFYEWDHEKYMLVVYAKTQYGHDKNDTKTVWNVGILPTRRFDTADPVIVGEYVTNGVRSYGQNNPFISEHRLLIQCA